MANTVTLRAQDGNIVRLECHDFLPSTHDLAREYARADYPDRFTVFAERCSDTSLLGGEHYLGERVRGVFLSCILRPAIFPSQAGFLGAMSALALETALEEHTDRKLGISWISDIYCEGRKIGGVSIEGRLDNFTAYEYIIVTFAAELSEEDFPPRLNDLVRQVFESESISIPQIIAKTVLQKFFLLYPFLQSPDKFMNTYREKFLLPGLKATYIDPKTGKKKRGRVLSIKPDTGELIIDPPGHRTDLVYLSSPKKLFVPDRIKLRNRKKMHKGEDEKDAKKAKEPVGVRK